MNIRIVAPSATLDSDAIHLAQQQIQEFGINASFSTHLFAQYRYLAGTVNERLADLKAACEDTNIDAIWCGRGGTGSAQLLLYLDSWILNKPIIGYSDSTVLLNYITMHGGTALHAPVFQEIATKNLNDFTAISSDAQEILALLNPVLKNQTSHYPIQAINTAAQHIVTSSTSINGTVLGGNLTTLCSLQGTPWALQLNQPSILLIEDVGEAYYSLERLLVQLLQSINISSLKAIILGDFYNCPQKNVPHSIAQIFAEHLDPLNIPMYIGDWFGHGEQNRPFWVGKTGHIQHNQLMI